MKTADIVRIGNAQAFWGDSPDAPARLMSQQPDLDFLTLDYLAEVSLSILALQREKDPAAGYARDFIGVLKSLVPFWKKGSRVRVVCNAGGLNPEGCALACVEALKAAGCGHLKVFVVSGDDVLPVLGKDPGAALYRNLETGESMARIAGRLVAANAYLGARPIAEALQSGADIVVTGRVADPSLTVGPCMAHLGWTWEDWDKLASATVAGHLIECGTQVTGGILTGWMELGEVGQIGFPFVEMEAGGSFVITKPDNTGGEVSLRTVKEQLLYEVGDPDQYLSPDVTVSFLNVSLNPVGEDRIAVCSARGRAPTDSYKVSAAYRDGFKSHGLLTVFGRDAAEKARRCGEIVLQRLEMSGAKPERSLIECLGAGASVAGVGNGASKSNLMEAVLRVSVADPRRDVVERFTRELAPLITSGPQGVTGYAAGRPKVQEVFGYWPCLIAKTQVKPVVKEITG